MVDPAPGKVARLSITGDAQTCDSALDAVGGTPIVRLHRLEREIAAGTRLYMKLEHLNLGGSHKSRIALAMIRDAEERGILVPGSGQTIVEPSGGNTGIGLAIACNIKGYSLVLVIPDNYSAEKQRLLRLYDARIILSDSSRGNNSHGDLAQALLIENPCWVMLNQQRNPANPAIHRQQTAPEILGALANDPPDAVVGGIGTGGHMTGLGHALRREWPCLELWGVQPEGCDLPAAKFAFHRIQGLAVGLIPDVLDLGQVNGMITVREAEARAACLELLQMEGLGVGVSSGANIAAVRQLAHQRADLETILTLSYDGIEQYLSEFETPEQP